MASTKGVLGTLSRGTKLDFSGDLPEEMFAIFFHVHVETLVFILVLPSLAGRGNILAHSAKFCIT